MASRNANGEGSIYRRKDGRYEAAIYLLTTAGIRKRVRVYGKTRGEVHEKLTALKGQADQGIPVPDKNWKLGDWLDHWLSTAVTLRRRALTYRRHETVTRLHLKPGLGRYSLHELSVSVVQRFLDEQCTAGQSRATVYQIRKVLSAALTYAVRQELIARNVARLVEIPTYRPKKAEHWTADETRRFLEAAKGDALYPLFVVLVLYGLRSGEVRGLRWCDVDFEQNVIRVRQQVQRIGGELQQVELKTDSSERDEPLLPTARQVLVEHLTSQNAVRQTAGVSWQGSGNAAELVFTTRSGRPIEARNLYRSFQRICATHGIARITLHGVRHSNATTQKSLNVHSRDIQAILGHGDVRTTGIYEHVDMDSKRQALGKVESRLFFRTIGLGVRCRQMLPSTRKFVDEFTSIIFGGSSQTRTGDTRLFRENGNSLNDRLTEVDWVLAGWRLQWLVGAVAVGAAVKVTETTNTS